MSRALPALVVSVIFAVAISSRGSWAQSCLEPDPVVLYTAVFLDAPSRVALLEAYPPIHEVVYVDHMTMIYQPCAAALNDSKVTPWGLQVILSVYGNQSDSKGQAVVVTPSPQVYSQNNFTHVTISCAHGVGAVYSNELLQDDGYVPAHDPFLLLSGKVGAIL